MRRREGGRLGFALHYLDNPVGQLAALYFYKPVFPRLQGVALLVQVVVLVVVRLLDT